MMEIFKIEQIPYLLGIIVSIIIFLIHLLVGFIFDSKQIYCDISSINPKDYQDELFHEFVDLEGNNEGKFVKLTFENLSNEHFNDISLNIRCKENDKITLCSTLTLGNNTSFGIDNNPSYEHHNNGTMLKIRFPVIPFHNSTWFIVYVSNDSEVVLPSIDASIQELTVADSVSIVYYMKKNKVFLLVLSIIVLLTFSYIYMMNLKSAMRGPM